MQTPRRLRRVSAGCEGGLDWACPLLSMCLQNLLFHERQRGIIARMGELDWELE